MVLNEHRNRFRNGLTVWKWHRYLLSRVAWENGYNESFNGKLRDELLNGEIFYTLQEAKILLERCRLHYNTRVWVTGLQFQRPHSHLKQ